MIALPCWKDPENIDGNDEEAEYEEDENEDDDERALCWGLQRFNIYSSLLLLLPYGDFLFEPPHAWGAMPLETVTSLGVERGASRQEIASGHPTKRSNDIRILLQDHSHGAWDRQR